MPVDVRSEKLRELVDENAEVEQLATGFTFTEGPIWNQDGRFLLFSDMPADMRRRWSERGRRHEVANPSNKGNGMTYDADGRLLVCEHVDELARPRCDPDGTAARDARLALPGQGAEQPERRRSSTRRLDLLQRPDLRPHAGLRHRARAAISTSRASTGSPPGGGDPQLLVDDFEQPNGLCFSPDESLLYINDTPTRTSASSTCSADGSIANGRLFADNIGDGEHRKGGLVDGMKCDERGNIWVTGPGRRLGVPPGRRAPRRRRDPGERRQHRTGAAPTGSGCSSRRRRSLYRIRDEGRRRREPFMQ